MNDSKYSYTYDGNNNQTERLDQVWDGFNWVNNKKYSHTYDDNSNLTEWFYHSWIDFNWVNNYKVSYTYDNNNNLTEWFGQTWDGSNLINSWKYSSTYDDNNNQTERLDQVWDGSNWVNNWKYSYTYDDNNNLIELIEQDWDGANWVNSWREIRSYSPMTTIKYYVNTINAYYLSDNYPNPFNPSTTIEFTLPKTEFTTLKIFNILGKEVSTLVSNKLNPGNHTYKFDGKNLASGVYYYQLIAGDYRQVKKMILIK